MKHELNICGTKWTTFSYLLNILICFKRLEFIFLMRLSPCGMFHHLYVLQMLYIICTNSQREWEEVRHYRNQISPVFQSSSESDELDEDELELDSFSPRMGLISASPLSFVSAMFTFAICDRSRYTRFQVFPFYLSGNFRKKILIAETQAE